MAGNNNKRLYRSKDAIIGGVCAGIADYFDIDVTLVRIITVVLVLAGAGFPIILYIVCLVAVPKQTDEYTGYIDVQPVAPPSPQQNTPFNHDAAPVGAPGPRYATATVNAGASTSAPGSGVPGPGAAWTSASGSVGPGMSNGPGAIPASGASHMPGTPPPGASPWQDTSSAASTGTRPGAPSSGYVPPGPAPGSCYTATNPVAYDVTTNDEKETTVGKQTPGGSFSAAIIIGIVLVAIGILALVGKVVGISVWRFWPLILILAGLVQMFTPGKEGWSLKRAGDGIVTISIGVVLQAWMLGFIAFSTFVQGFLHFWPILLVVVGLAVIGTALKNNIVMLLSSLVFSAALVFGVWYYGDFSQPMVFQLNNGRELTLNVPASPRQEQESTSSNQMTLELTGIETAKLLYKGGATEARISAGNTEAVELETISVVGGIEMQSQTAANLYLIEGATPEVVVESGNVIQGGSQRILLPRDVDWERIDIDAGASSLRLNLEDLRVGRVSINSGVSSISLQLGEPLATGSEVDIKAGITSTEIKVSKDSAVIIYSEGLNSVTVDESVFTWDESLKAWCSDTYMNGSRGRRVVSVPVWTIQQEGLSALDVRTY